MYDLVEDKEFLDNLFSRDAIADFLSTVTLVKNDEKIPLDIKKDQIEYLADGKVSVIPGFNLVEKKQK